VAKYLSEKIEPISFLIRLNHDFATLSLRAQIGQEKLNKGSTPGRKQCHTEQNLVRGCVT